MEDILPDTEDRMKKAVGVLKNSLAGIRGGRVAPGLVDSLKVDVHGSQVPIKQLASVITPEPTRITIRPYDPSMLKNIEKTIQAANLGLNPQSDGRMIRINVPPPSGETRRKLASRVRELAEEARVAIRNIRRDGNREARDRIPSEDRRDNVIATVQNMTKDHESQVAQLSSAREHEVLER